MCGNIKYKYRKNKVDEKITEVQLIEKEDKTTLVIKTELTIVRLTVKQKLYRSLNTKLATEYIEKSLSNLEIDIKQGLDIDLRKYLDEWDLTSRKAWGCNAEIVKELSKAI